MPDDVVGSARIRIEPDFTGFDAALEAGVQQAADQAAEQIVAAFRAAAQTSAEELSGIGQAGFVDVTTTADAAAADLEAVFGAAADEADAALASIGEGAGETIVGEFDGTGDRIASELAAGADEATASLEGIGAGAGDEIVDEFVGVGAAIAGDIEAGAAQAEQALSSIGAGAGDQLAGEFAGAGEAISSTVQQGASDASAALSALEGAGQGVVENLAQGFEGLGGVIAAAVGGLALAGAFSAAERVASVAGITNRLLETTGNVAGITAAEIVGLGDSLEGLTGIESELVQEASNVLLTFKNVRNEVGAGNDIFNRAIRSGADLSAVLGGEITGSALQLGKALNDPIRGLSVLGRAGVTFTAEQKELVRSLVDENDLLSAQKVILEEVEGQVGGAAEASARASDRIRASLGNIAEEFGAGLLPAADAFADRLPEIIDDVGPQVRELGEALGDGLQVAVDGFLALTPLLGVTTDLLVLLVPVLETGVDLIEAIPDPVLQAAAALYAVNKALILVRGTAALTATGLGRLAVPAGAISGAFNVGAGAAPRFAGGLRGLTTGLSGATLAAGAGLTALTLYSDMMGNAREEGIAFGQSVRDDFDLAAMSTSELADLSERLGTEIGNLRGQVDDSFFGRNTINKDFNETIRAGADELERFQGEVDAARIEMQRLDAEAEFGARADRFVGISDAVATLRSESGLAADAVTEFRLEGDAADDAFLTLATTLDAATLSEEGMAAAADALGVSVESLEGFVTGVDESLQGFIDTALSGLPQISGAFRDTNEDAQVSAREFITGLNEDALQLATFFGDIRTITEAGFAEVAGTLAEQGAEVAGAATHELAEAARKGNLELLLRTQEGLNARETAIAGSTDFLVRVLGPDFVTANGTVAREATEAFGENFDPEEQVRIAMALANSGLDADGQRIAALAATVGDDAAREFGNGLNLDDRAIEQAIAAGVAIAENAPHDAFRQVGNELGGDLAFGIADGLRFSQPSIDAEAERFLRNVEIAARSAAGAESPSKTWARLGSDLADGLAVGLIADSDVVVAAAEQIIADASAAIAAAPVADLRVPTTIAEERLRSASPSLLVRANDSVPDDLIPWNLRFDDIADAIRHVAAFPPAGPPGVGSPTSLDGVTIDARDWRIEAPDPEAAADAVIRRLRAEVFLQRRS